MYLLDTNVCVGLLKGDAQLASHCRRISPKELAVCSVVRAELYYGARKSERVEKNLSILRRFLAPLQSVAFEDSAAEEYGVIRAGLELLGRPIGSNDLMIASIAKANDCVLVTRNTTEFNRVTGLRLESWG